MSRVVAPTGNMGLVEVKGNVADKSPEERSTPMWSKTVLHSPCSGGGGAGAAITDGHRTFTEAIPHSRHCKECDGRKSLKLGKEARQPQGNDGCR